MDDLKNTLEKLREIGFTALQYSVPDSFDVKEVKKAFDTFTQLYRVYDGSWGTVQSIIETQSELLEIDLTEYNKAGDSKTDICKALCGNLYESKEAFRDAFNEIVSEKYIGEASDYTWKESDAYSLDDTFILKKEKGKDFVILNITDTHFSDYDFRAFFSVCLFKLCKRLYFIRIIYFIDCVEKTVAIFMRKT